MKGLFTLLMLVIPHSVFTDSHCLALISTFIKGDTPFPELSATLELDDLTVAYFDFEKKVFFSREPHKEEEVDTVVDPETVKTTLSYLQDDFEKTWIYVSHELNVTEMKPRVRLIQKKHSVSGWDGVSCLATGFYPRHINLTILRDGEPVPERLTTGGEPLPNGDGTYQMRKNLELSGEDLKQSLFTCNVTHLGLEFHVELGPGKPMELIVIPVLAAVGLVFLVGAGICVMIKHKRKQGATLQIKYSAPSTDSAPEAGDTTQSTAGFTFAASCTGFD